MRPLLCFLLPAVLASSVRAESFSRVLRAAKHPDRKTRRAALLLLAEGTVVPRSKAHREKMIRSLATYLNSRSLGPDRALAVRALGTLKSEPTLLRISTRVKNERDDRVLAAMESVFREASEEWFDILLARFREEKDLLARAAYLRMALSVSCKDARTFARIRSRIHDDWVIQATAVEALQYDREPGIDAIGIEILDHSDPAVVGAAIQVLTAVTGKRFGRDVIAWKTWWNTRDSVPDKIPDEQKPVKSTETRTVAETQGPVRSYFFGVPIRGKKIVYVFDISGSMRKKLPIAYRQLVQSIKGLPPSSSFEVVFFHEHVFPWRRRFTRADPVSKALLIRHLDELEIKSYTNLYDAIELGLTLRPDEMFVISDGLPNRGRKKFPRDILKALKERAGRTRIHTVSVIRTSDGGKHVRLLQQIAEQHGGQAITRTLY